MLQSQRFFSLDLEERAQYIHDAQVSVRTDKDREAEAKLEKLQDDLQENLSPACQSLQDTADTEQQKFYLAHAAYKRGGPGGTGGLRSDYVGQYHQSP